MVTAWAPSTLVEGSKLLAVLERVGGQEARGDVVVERREQVLLVVGVEEESSGVVAELGEGLVGGSKDGLEARGGQQRGNSSLASSSHQGRELGERLGNVQDGGSIDRGNRNSEHENNREASHLSRKGKLGK